MEELMQSNYNNLLQNPEVVSDVNNITTNPSDTADIVDTADTPATSNPPSGSVTQLEDQVMQLSLALIAQQ